MTTVIETRYVDDLLGEWSHWIWRRNTGHSLAIKPSSAYSLAMPGGTYDRETPDTRADVLRFDRLFRATQLLQESHRQIVWVHYTMSGRVSERIAHFKITRDAYYERLNAAKLQIDHFMSLPTTAW